jgi:hypothetical protein
MTTDEQITLTFIFLYKALYVGFRMDSNWDGFGCSPPKKYLLSRAGQNNAICDSSHFSQKKKNLMR